MKLTIEVWRQAGPETKGKFVSYQIDNLDESMSILEMLDRLNDDLIIDGQAPIAFDSDCRESTCGACAISVNGRPGGQTPNLSTCMQRLSQFMDGQVVRLEPLRAKAFPVVQDLVVDRSALDRLLAVGTTEIDFGHAEAADDHRVDPDQAEAALDMAACIGCGACVAACPNGSAYLFTGAKLAHLGLLPTDQAEKSKRVIAMTTVAEAEFGPCSLHEECLAVCPANLPATTLTVPGHERLAAWLRKGSAS